MVLRESRAELGNRLEFQGHRSPNRDECTASHPSRTMRGVRPRAAIESAGLFPDGVHWESRKSNPRHVTTEGRFRSIGLQSCAGRYDCQLRFRLASQGIITAAASKIPIPTRLRCASRYPIKFKIEVSTTKPANAKSKPPAIRAARASASVKRKRQNTTAAESNSIKLSPPKANSAGLCEVQAVPREMMASILIQMSVMT